MINPRLAQRRGGSDEQDLDEGPWAGFADEVRHLVTEADYAALGLTRPLPPPTDCMLAPGVE